MGTETTDHGTITDAALDELRSRLGKELRHLRRSAVVTDEWIERYAFAIGDQHPLWTDRTYAELSPHRSLLAPPTMVYVLSGWDIGTGLPGVHGMFVRSHLEWSRPIREGDRLLSVGRLYEVTERPSRFAGRSVLQGTETVFSDAEGAAVCRARNWNLRTERGEARRRGTVARKEKHTYTAEDRARIERDVFRETIRGDLPRRWADTHVGEVLPAVVKGPLTVTDMVGYMRGGFGGIAHGFFMYTHGLGTAFRRRHPSAVMWTSLGIADSPEAVHWDDELARAAGVPAAYDLGPQRIAWMATVVTNWMGDTAFLRSLDSHLKKFVIMADTVWCRGVVTGKQRDGERGLVTVGLEAMNQLGELVAVAEAVVELPE
ncbi:MAG: MaoC family dehydratase N-terminal domain-containing protein [Candidatus Rokubacteria bacterium]|nr:MaoC family dehydratase N-terminal domain-containing protein [Candidatus Rokubacteria bacterium]